MSKYETYIRRYLTKHNWELLSERPRRWWHKDYGERSEAYAVMMQCNLNREARRSRLA